MERDDPGLLRIFGGKVGKLLHEVFVDADEDQREATARIERMYAFVDLMMLAILADGSMLDEELDVLEARLLEAPELDITVDEARSRIRFKAERIDSPQKMRNAMAAAANRLPNPEDRALAYQMAAELRNAGARLGEKRGGYRANLRFDAGLLQLFAETLEIPDERREDLERAPLPEAFDRD